MLRLIDRIRAVGFDLDGTLIDTAPDLGDAANMMLVMLGGRPLPEQRIPYLIGAGIDRFVANVLMESLGGATPDPQLQTGAAALFRNLYRQRLFARGRIFPGVHELLERLADAGTPLCCITNKETAFALPLLEAAELRSYFKLTLCADRPEDRKPSANLLLAACAQLDIEPHHMLYVGDSRSDVIAARSAGCRYVAVDYGYHCGVPVGDLKPDGVIGDLAEIISLCLRPLMSNRALRAT